MYLQVEFPGEVWVAVHDAAAREPGQVRVLGLVAVALDGEQGLLRLVALYL